MATSRIHLHPVTERRQGASATTSDDGGTGTGSWTMLVSVSDRLPSSLTIASSGTKSDRSASSNWTSSCVGSPSTASRASSVSTNVSTSGGSKAVTGAPAASVTVSAYGCRPTWRVEDRKSVV